MKARPRVLLLSATSGAGDVRAAQALEKAFVARARAMAIIEPISGHEERGAEHLLEAAREPLQSSPKMPGGC